MSAARVLGACAVLLPLSALAWPADVYLDVEVGAEKFQRLGAVDWLEVEDPSVASVEWLDSGELLVTGKAPGRTLVLLYAQGSAAAWRIRVSAKGERTKPVPSDAALAVARKACPGLEMDANGSTLTVGVHTEACRAALFAFFQTDAVRASDAELTYDLAALQSQLQALEKAWSGSSLKVEAKYIGAGLRLEGAVSPAAHRRVLWDVFRRTAGRMVLDDRLEVAPDAADAGAKRP